MSLLDTLKLCDADVSILAFISCSSLHALCASGPPSHASGPPPPSLFSWICPCDRCPQCSTDKQNLVHVLNSCKTALELRRYNMRHDAVLRKLSRRLSRLLQKLALTLMANTSPITLLILI